MPYGKRKRSSSRPGSSKRYRRTIRSRRRRSYRKRRGGGRRRYDATRIATSVTTPSRTVNLRTLGFPRSMVVHLPYREYINIATGTTGNLGYYQFRLNSLFDPNYSGTGAQPRYFDQLCSNALYNRYRVYKADVSVSVRNRSADDVQAVCMVRDDPTITYTLAINNFYASEMPYTATRMLNAASEGGDKHRTVFKFTIDVAKFFGISKTTFYGDNLYRAAYNSSPARGPILTVGVSDDPVQTTAGLSADFEVTIVYHALMYDLADDVAQS